MDIVENISIGIIVFLGIIVWIYRKKEEKEMSQIEINRGKEEPYL